MATNDYGFFFNSINGDRVYDADSFSTWLRKFFTSGVFEGELAVTAAEGMAVEVGSGYANVDGKVRFFNSPQTIALSPANSTYPRIDTIVVERNDVDREIVLKYITGQYSGNTPSPTERQWGSGVYQLVLAQIYVGAGATSISQANIADTRPDSSLCGYVVGTVEEIDLSQILAQSQEQFAEWFDRMKGQLSDDAAGNLQLEIDSINDAAGNLQLEIDSINDVLYDQGTDGAHFERNLKVEGSADIHQGLVTPTIQSPSDRLTVQDNLFVSRTLVVQHNLVVSGTLTLDGFAVPRMQNGSVTISDVTSTHKEFSVTFPKGFSATPNVQLTARHNSASAVYVKLKSVSATGFTADIWSGATTGITPTVDWLAML